MAQPLQAWRQRRRRRRQSQQLLRRNRLLQSIGCIPTKRSMNAVSGASRGMGASKGVERGCSADAPSGH